MREEVAVVRGKHIPVVLLGLLTALSARAGEIEDCTQLADPALTVEACTALIRSGALGGHDLAIAYNNRGNALDNFGKPAQAIEDYDKALNLDPKFVLAWYNRGLAYDNLGKLDRAIQDYDQALQIDPTFARVYQNRAHDRCELGQVEASIEDRMRAIEFGFWSAEFFQRALSDLGFYNGPIDGDFGPASKKALREWTEAGCP